MKICAVAAVLLVSLFAVSMASPAYKRMAYYQQPSVYFQARASPQRMHFQRYVQQPSARTHARQTALDEAHLKEDAASVEQQTAEESIISDAGTNEAEPYPPAGGQASAEFEGTFADGGVDTGLVAGAPSAEVPASGEAPEAPELPEAPVVDNQVLDDDSVPSAAVPEVAPSAEELPSDDDAKVPREFNFETPAAEEPVETPVEAPVEAAVEEPVAEEAAPEVPELPEVPEVPSLIPEQAPAEEAPIASAAPVETPLAAAAPAVPAVAPVATTAAVAPPKRYLPPRRKVTVKLDEQSGAAHDDDEQADSYRPARIPNARRPVKGSGSAVAAKGTKAQLPAGTFFPINFGGTTGGAIAIANSFSTGEGGSATSHAIAYGSPDAARSKARPIRRRH